MSAAPRALGSYRAQRRRSLFLERYPRLQDLEPWPAGLTIPTTDGYAFVAADPADDPLHVVGRWVEVAPEELAEAHGLEVIDRPLVVPQPFDLWRARSLLAAVQRAAHSRQRSPHAVLGAVLARLGAAVSHTIRLPAIVGAPSPLSVFTLLVGPAGVGKGGTYAISKELLPLPDVYEIPPGSGEGLVEALFDFVEDEKGKQQKIQVRHSVIVYVDEGEVLTQLGSRSGATLLPTLRTAWSGYELGASNASRERTRRVPAGQYTFGVVMGIQPERAGPLLADAAAGLPQRFLWTPATDAAIPDVPTPWPGALSLQPTPPLDHYAQRDATGYIRHYMQVVDEIVSEIREADLAVARGRQCADVMAAHGYLLQLRVAALLALVEGRMEVSVDDWHIARHIKSHSDATVAGTRAVLQAEERQQEDSTAGKRSRVEARMTDHRIVECAQRVAAKVVQRPGCSARYLRQCLPNWRDVLTAGIDHALGKGWVLEKSEPGRGGDRRAFYPPERRG
jgi:hypothetical protein